MKKYGIGLLCVVISLGTLWPNSEQNVMAIGFFKNGFFEMYVPDSPSSDAEKNLEKAAKAKTGKCWICHVNMKAEGEEKLGKKVRNNYGKAVSEFLDKENFSSKRRKAEPEVAAKEVQAALKKVESMKSDPSDPNSPTFKELIEAGKLPGNGKPDPGDLENAIKERENPKPKK
ncbi:MAG: hypothetical protein N2F24_12180 [Deltaproteobacteria bacterium]